MKAPSTAFLVHRADKIAFGHVDPLVLSVETCAELHAFHMAEMRKAIAALRGLTAHRHRVLAKSFEAAIADHAKWKMRGVFNHAD